jgi:hypothetical protein
VHVVGGLKTIFMKKCTEWKVLKNARNRKFKKMHGIENLKNARNGKFKKCTK